MISDASAASGGTQSWPAITEEDLPWHSRLPETAVSGRLRARHFGPYRATVTPVIAEAPVRLRSEVLRAADDASIEIARFDREFGPRSVPFSAILLRSESAASSQIENLTSSAKAIALAEIGEGDKQNARLIVANTLAMSAAMDMADRLDEQAIVDMHRVLLGRSAPEITGGWRTMQVWIEGSGYGPHEAVFVPPQPDRVPDAMADLVRFCARDDIPAFVQAAIAHAQFETIHPFPDGNGRTGRALIHALLRAKGVTQDVTVPVSAGLLTDTRSYFDALTTYRQGDPGVLITLMSDAAMTAMANGRHLLADLLRARDVWESRVLARRDAAVWRLLDVLIRQPVVSSAVVSRELNATAANALRAIDQAVTAGVLAEMTGYRRNRLWQATDVLTALDDFAARAGRRTVGGG